MSSMGHELYLSEKMSDLMMWILLIIWPRFRIKNDTDQSYWLLTFHYPVTELLVVYPSSEEAV